MKEWQKEERFFVVVSNFFLRKTIFSAVSIAPLFLRSCTLLNFFKSSKNVSQQLLLLFCCWCCCCCNVAIKCVTTSLHDISFPLQHCHRLPCFDFTNILLAAFMREDPKSEKKLTPWLFFCAFGTFFPCPLSYILEEPSFDPCYPIRAVRGQWAACLQSSRPKQKKVSLDVYIWSVIFRFLR